MSGDGNDLEQQLEKLLLQRVKMELKNNAELRDSDEIDADSQQVISG